MPKFNAPAVAVISNRGGEANDNYGMSDFNPWWTRSDLSRYQANWVANSPSPLAHYGPWNKTALGGVNPSPTVYASHDTFAEATPGGPQTLNDLPLGVELSGTAQGFIGEYPGGAFRNVPVKVTRNSASLRVEVFGGVFLPSLKRLAEGVTYQHDGGQITFTDTNVRFNAPVQAGLKMNWGSGTRSAALSIPWANLK